MRFKAAVLALALWCSVTHSLAEEAPPYIGQYDPDAECAGPASNPVCAYKTWFYCRIVDNDEMCDYIMGQGPRKQWEEEPWTLALSDMMHNTLDVYGYAFIGTQKVTAERLGPNPSKAAQRLIGATEVMDTYGDPEKPGIAYIGSEFYAQTSRGRWRLVGWSIDVEGGEAELPCDDPQDADDDTCKIKLDDIPTWAERLRAGKLK